MRSPFLGNLWHLRSRLFNNMSIPEHNIFIESHHQLEVVDPWTCFRCSKTVSASRPPVFNADNCSCVEMGSFSNSGAQATQLPTYEPRVYHHEVDTSAYYPQPQSYASSSLSVPCPEGPEREVPNVNKYLPLAPEAGRNEVEHRRSSSFRSNMSYQMRRYLVEPDHAVDSAPVETRFLPQEVHITSKTSMQVNKSKPSYKSVQSWGDDASFYSWELDPVTGTGAWIDQDGDVYCRDEYPMTMSGVSDCVFDE